MKKIFSLFIALYFLAAFSSAQVQIHHTKTESLVNPIGLNVLQPRFSWQLVSDVRNVMQTAYELRVSDDAKTLTKGKATWSSNKKTSDQSIQVAYEGPALIAGKRYYWQVRVWDNKGKVSEWSTPSFFQTGLLQTTSWKASWIVPITGDRSRASALLRKEFSGRKKIKSATAYITAHGLYEVQMNGKRVGDAYLTPGWTSYNKRLQYQAYDVTNLVNQGSNAIGVTLGDGWYRGSFVFNQRKNMYGNDVALLFQLDIIYEDGATEQIVSDNSWKSSIGSIRQSEIYAGETIDARMEKNGWTTAGYKDNDWSGVKEMNFPKDILVGTYNEPIKKHETLQPVKVFTTPKGEQVIDFGQNLVGWVVVKVKGKTGDKITISHAEVLDKQGNFYTDNLRSAKAQDCYVLKGDTEEVFEPHFTWHGFRFIKIEGYPGEIKPENFTAVALYSDMATTGSFATSNPLINQLQHNIEWGLRGNFLDVPTDCPQRDERLGWSGDAQVFSRTATFLCGVNNFFAKWMKDVAADQLPDGRITNVIPNVLDTVKSGIAGWADVGTIIPWNMYLAYGDKRILETQYSSMKAWVDYMQKQSVNNLWSTGNHYGDWLFYSLADDPWGASAITNRYLIAQCFYAHSTQLLINTAKVLQKSPDVSNYTQLLQNIKAAFVKEYITGSGATMSNTQTSYVLALQFDMLPDSLRQQAAERLVNNIKQYKNHLTTGFLGTPYLCHVLSRFGYTDMAYTLLLQDTYPSWLYPVKMGATTIWERWDGIKPDGSFQTPGMNSFNHYAYGAIGDWMYRIIAGIDTDEDSVGYKKSIIRPHIGGGLTYATASHNTPYGKLSSSWKVDSGKLILDVEVPVNTTATVYIPVTNIETVMESNIALVGRKDIQVVGVEKECVIVTIGSGKYGFIANWK